jgi:zinc/manganese transport system substrate-binding protein
MNTPIHRGVTLLAAVTLAVMSVTVAVGQDDESPAVPTVVVTTEVLGAIVGDIVGTAADVRTLMSPGADPHSWQPSARDSEVVFGADLVVANGLDLEEGLSRVLEQAEADGVLVFHAADHVELRASADADDDHADDDHADGHGHGSGDPHFWLDPLAMRDVVAALGPVLVDAGIDVDGRADAQIADLEALDQELRALLAVIPDDQRRLVTGHGALGYFADAYEFEIVGTVVPGLSSTDEPSARDIAELVQTIRDLGAGVIFSDVGTPQSVAEAVAAETGADLVELDVARLPVGGTYADLMRGVAESVASALTSVAAQA